MNAVDSNILIEQILLKQPMVMASVFQQYRNLFNGHQLAKMIHEGPKSFSGLFKSKGRTALKALVSLEQGAPEQASHMPKLAHINPHIESLMREQRHSAKV